MLRGAKNNIARHPFDVRVRCAYKIAESSESCMTEDLHDVTGDTEDNGWLPLFRPDFGSQPLADRRREAFARALFEGIDVQAAYELAGFKRPAATLSEWNGSH
jgi:hypothetical protein